MNLKKFDNIYFFINKSLHANTAEVSDKRNVTFCNLDFIHLALIQPSLYLPNFSNLSLQLWKLEK